MTWIKLFVRKDCDLPTFSYSILTAYDVVWQYTKKKEEYLFAYFKNNNIHYYMQDADPNEVGRRLCKKYFSSPEKIKKLHQEGIQLLRETESKHRNWKRKLRTPTSKELLQAFLDFKKDFLRINYDYSILPWWALEAWQHDFQECVTQLIQQRGLQDQEEIILATLLKNWKPTAVEEIYQKYRQGVSISDLLQEYQFLRSWVVVWFKPISKEWIETVVQKPATNSKIKAMPLQKVIKLLHPTTEQKELLIMAPYIIFFKDWRDDVRRKHAYLWNFLFESLAQFFNIPYDDWGYLTIEEIEKVLRTGKLHRDIIELRKKEGCVLTVVPGELKVRVIDYPHIKPYEMIAEQTDQTKDGAIKGLVAQRGIVQGKVSVVRHFKDVYKIKEGDILVANTTHPNYLMAMKKAAAFITDEGGIASHAAIVAREMKKPCIVGTKNATQILKDGDVVEVNAMTGTVKKVKP